VPGCCSVLDSRRLVPGPVLVHSAVRLNKWIKSVTQIVVAFGLAALAAHLMGGTAMIASSAVNLAVAIGVAVGGRVGSSSEGGGPLGPPPFASPPTTGARRR
jgi:hypothetical protein